MYHTHYPATCVCFSWLFRSFFFFLLFSSAVCLEQHSIPAYRFLTTFSDIVCSISWIYSILISLLPSLVLQHKMLQTWSFEAFGNLNICLSEIYLLYLMCSILTLQQLLCHELTLPEKVLEYS